MKYFAMRGSQDINKNWPLCNSICFKFFSKEIQSPRLHSTMLSAGKPNILGRFANLLEISVYKALVWVKKLSLWEWSWKYLVLFMLISTMPMLSSRWVLQSVSSLWKKGNLITALPGPGLPQKQLKLRALSKAIQTTPMGSRLAPNLTCPCGMERRAPLQRGAG